MIAPRTTTQIDEQRWRAFIAADREGSKFACFKRKIRQK